MENLLTARFCALQAFNELPSTLRTLSITQIKVTADDFATCHLPLLRAPQLRECGVTSDAVATTLLERCPELKKEKTKVHITYDKYD